ncbi:DUF2007 domain-containing protein [Kineococcus xinjiangensis]|uniref:DUF2007 domain-containing protein n=1 Tax=Kineococcus xinjiangensis TaxID=512762 RepID=UPI000CECA7FD|nr:DUF2007 domain-containing protein [Kineococcus xinjiangensis]
MPWGGYHYLFGPVVALAVVAVLALLLRWGFSSGSSLVQRRPSRGREGEYGLLEVVAAPPGPAEAEVLRGRLEDAGIRATLVPTTDGPRLMVFPEDAPRARQLLRGPTG